MDAVSYREVYNLVLPWQHQIITPCYVKARGADHVNVRDFVQNVVLTPMPAMPEPPAPLADKPTAKERKAHYATMAAHDQLVYRTHEERRERQKKFVDVVDKALGNDDPFMDIRTVRDFLLRVLPNEAHVALEHFDFYALGQASLIGWRAQLEPRRAQHANLKRTFDVLWEGYEEAEETLRKCARVEEDDDDNKDE
jgi:hypothetical protein